MTAKLKIAGGKTKPMDLERKSQISSKKFCLFSTSDFQLFFDIATCIPLLTIRYVQYCVTLECD